MKIDIKHLAKLSNLRFDESEAEKLEKEMGDIIGMVEKMPDIVGSDLKPDPNNRMTLREDEVKPSLPRTEMLKNVPQSQAGCIVVPKVVE